MKNAKKLALLLLSLVLLIGVFAVWAFAEEENATVVYPDGSTVSLAVGETIVPKEFTDGLYAGDGNTLYKDDATEGWTFKVEGADAPLAELVVPAEAAGKKIIASGADKVYFSSLYQGTTSYHTTNNVNTYCNAVNFNKAGGTVTLYEDVDVADFSFGTNSGGYTLYFDLNGHTVRVKNTMNVQWSVTCIISKVPGAHFYSDASGAMFQPVKGANSTLYLGADVNGNYKDNISFHCGLLLNNVECNASNDSTKVSIYGGHYYQTKASAFFADISGPVAQIVDATFHLASESTGVFVADGAVLANTVLTNKNAVNNCTFYSAKEIPVLNTSVEGNVTFTNCEFYGVKAVDAGESSTVTAAEDTNTFADAVTYRTVTWADGSKSYYLAASLDEAKAFVENHPKADRDTAITKMEGDELFVALKPASVYEYDASFNCVETDVSVFEKVYYVSVETLNGETRTVYHLVNDVDKYFSSANKGDRGDGTNTGAFSFDQLYVKDVSRADVTLYADVTTNSFSLNWFKAAPARLLKAIPVTLDLNGHTVTNNQTGWIDTKGVSITIYSSVPGAHWYQTKSPSMFRTNDDSCHKLGAKDENGTYKDNISFHGRCVFTDIHGSGAYIWGGKYYQSANSTYGGFINLSRRIYKIANAEFYVLAGQPVFVDNDAHDGASVATGTTVYDCTFYAAGAADIISAAQAAVPQFRDCKFINFNMAKNQGEAVLDFIGTIESSNGSADVFGTKVLAKVDAYAATGLVAEDGSEISANLNYKLTTETETLKVITDLFTDYYTVGASFSDNAGDFYEIVGDKINTAPKYVLTDVAEIVDGKVASAGEVTLDYEYTVLGDDIAFTYLDTKTSTLYAAGYATHCGSTEAGIFAKFYELFNAPASAYTITMYKDMTMTQAIAFGPYIAGVSQPYYEALSQGNFTLDLNGKTITVAEDLAGINMCNSNDSGYLVYTRAVFGLEGDKRNTLTVQSSAAGGKIVNLSNNALFCIGEWDANNLTINGANLTIESKGTIFGSFEASTMNININGGTYIYNGDRVAFVATGTVNVSDATIVLTSEKAYAAFAGCNYPKVKAVFTVDNVRIFAEGAKLFSYANHQTFSEISAATSPQSESTLAFNNCTFAGITLIREHADLQSITYSGTTVASSLSDLAFAMPEAPEGTVAAYGYVTYGGVDYKVASYILSENAGRVNWGFGIVEYWAVGARATHEDVEIDGYFAYTFDAIDSVVAGDQAATKTVSIRPGTIQMNLTLQSKIGLNIFVTEALSDAIVTVGGTSFTLAALAAEDAYYKLSKAIDPNVADDVIAVTVQIGENVHELSVSIGNYAKKILATDAYADVHNLTYAMAKYVEAMTGTNIVAGVEAPAGYVAQTVEAAPSENDGVLLENIRFNLADTIAIEILGAQNTDGKNVSITLASGRVETAVLADGTVLFTGLNVNEFYGDLTIAVEDEEYTYSLANYLAGLTEDSDKAVVQALHNYTYYADLYMDAQ